MSSSASPKGFARPCSARPSIADARCLDGLCCTVAQHGATLDALRSEFSRTQRAVAQLRAEATALQGCLFAAGLVSATRFEVELHRRRFASTCTSHPLGHLEAKLEQVLEHQGAGIGCASAVGITAIREATVASRAVGRAAAELIRHLDGVGPVHIFVCGGYDGAQSCKSVEHLGPPSRLSLSHPMDLSRGEWLPAPCMLSSRQQGAIAVLRGSIFVCGGWDGDRALNSVERYDLRTAVWEVQSAMRERRDGAAAASFARNVYVMGGRNTSELASAECLDPEKGIWEPLPNMATARRSAAAAAAGGNLLICGGERGARNLACVERFDPHARAWLQFPPMLEQRAAHAAAVASQLLCVFGGWCESRTLSSAEAFDFNAQCWSHLPEMAQHRDGAAACAVAGRIYVFGGLDGWRPLNSVECLDLEVGRWTRMPSMQHCRVYACAAALKL